MKNAVDAVIYNGRQEATYSDHVYTAAIEALGMKHEDVVCLTADMTYLLEVGTFRDSFPERAFNVGMAEQNMVGVASGMAQAGEVPFIHTFACFITRRCMDQIVNAVAYPRRNVKIVGMMPGITSHGGPSHQAIDDLSLMRGTPHMTVLDIGDATEAAQFAQVAYDIDGPVYIRLRSRRQPLLFDPVKYQLEVGQSYLLREGSDVALVTSGIMTRRALEAAALLEDQGISTNVLHVPSIKPMDAEGILHVAANSRVMITLDNHSILGGLGNAVGDVLLENNVRIPFHRVGLPDQFAKAASEGYLARLFGMEADQIAQAAVSVLEGKKVHVQRVAEGKEHVVLGSGGGWEEKWKK